MGSETVPVRNHKAALFALVEILGCRSLHKKQFFETNRANCQRRCSTSDTRVAQSHFILPVVQNANNNKPERRFVGTVLIDRIPVCVLRV